MVDDPENKYADIASVVMSSSGVGISPTTGRPVEEAIKEKAVAQDKQEEAILKIRAMWLEATRTAAGVALLALVRKKLEDRVVTLVKADPEANAYVKLLEDLGVKEKLASAAAKTLFQRSLKQEGNEQ